MSGMPKYWLNKIPEMVAMDRWFGIAAQQSGQLEQRYKDAIDRLTNDADVFKKNSKTLRSHFGNQGDADDDMHTHFSPDWVNMNNPS